MAQQLTSESNEYIQHLYKLVNDSHYRNLKQKVVIEGQQMIAELLPLVKEGTLLYTSMPPFPIPPSFEQIQISEKISKKLSAVKNEHEMFLEAPLPKNPLLKNCSRLLVLDGVSDPGNLGTLLRTCLALGWEGVYFLPGCCDPFNDKALRASKGALFRLPYLQGNWEELERLNLSLDVFGADLEGDLPETIVSGKMMLILGNEGQGLSKESKSRSKKITLPMKSGVESLNVAAAGAILMYEMRPK